MTWFNSTNSNATNGSNIIKINDNQSVANIRPSDALVLSSFAPVEIFKAYVTSHGTFIELIKPWPNATQSQVPCVVLPTSGDFNTAVSALNNASKMVNDNYKSMLDWQTKLGSVQFSDLDGNTQTVKTLRQMQSEIDAVNPYPWAMRKVEFEARRQQNIEKYVASGFVNMGLHIDIETNPAAGEGLWTWLSSPNLMSLGVAETDSGGQGRSKTKYSTLHISGLLFDLKQLCHINYVFIKLPPAEDGTRTYDSATGISVTHSSPSIAFASETETNKVVTNRVDMWGFGSFLREINHADPFVYRYGLIHSRAPNINGVTTSDDNIRPIEYFAWYEGDTTSRGRGVNWQTATEAQRMAIASDPANNIYFDDATGKFYQQCVRGRSFAGLGNGDWLNSGESLNYVIGFDAHNTSRVPVHGKMDTPEKNLTASSGFFSALSNYSTNPVDKGVYTSQRNTSASSDGLVYFLPCGTVNRLNQGVHHPLNLSGTAPVRFKNGTGAIAWHDARTKFINSKSDAFNPDNIGYAGAGVVNGAPILSRGKIGENSGRPDRRCYDAIYTNGQGGVCRDMRYSSKALSLEDFAEQDLKVKSGQYRGVELLGITKVGKVTTTGAVYSAGYTKLVASGQRYSSEFSEWDGYNFSSYNDVDLHGCFIIGESGTLYPLGVCSIRNNVDATTYVGASAGDVSSDFPTGEYYVILMRNDLLPSVSGKYMHSDVFGHPANILRCNDLRSGWIGGYSVDLPNGMNERKMLSRPVHSIEKTSCQYYNETNGWLSTDVSHSLNVATSSVGDPIIFADGNVVIVNYMTNAKLTKNANNSNVQGGKHAIGDVFVSKSYQAPHGAMLGYSLINKVMTCDDNVTHKDYVLSSYTLKDNKLDFATHPPIELTLPANNGPAFKALSYVTEHNGQPFLNYAYTEIKHNGTDWGDDGAINSVNAQSTMLDGNGNIVCFGTAQITEPLGWLKK